MENDLDASVRLAALEGLIQVYVHSGLVTLSARSSGYWRQFPKMRPLIVPRGTLVLASLCSNNTANRWCKTSRSSYHRPCTRQFTHLRPAVIFHPFLRRDTWGVQIFDLESRALRTGVIQKQTLASSMRMDIVGLGLAVRASGTLPQHLWRRGCFRDVCSCRRQHGGTPH